MNTRTLLTQGQLSSEAENRAFRIVAIYDSAESSREAARASAVLLHELGDDIVVRKHSCHAVSLQERTTREQAVTEAAEADVIVIALEDDKPSQPLREWTSEWQRRRELSAGLLALIPCSECRTGGDLAQFLYETAVSANMDFLCRKPRRFQTPES